MTNVWKIYLRFYHSNKGIHTIFLKKLLFERAVIDNELHIWVETKSFDFSQ